MADQCHVRLDELERRVTVHDEKIDALSEKVSEFIGASKITTKLMAAIVAISALLQVALQFVHHHG